jgi:uncharacterized protein (TIGR03435 family)
MPVLDLVAFAYSIPSNQIFGPEWSKSEEYDVEATHGLPQSSPSGLAPMLQHLLQERFSLRVHREQRPMPVVVLDGLRVLMVLSKFTQRNEHATAGVCTASRRDPRRQADGTSPPACFYPSPALINQRLSSVARVLVQRSIGLFKMKGAPDRQFVALNNVYVA